MKLDKLCNKQDEYMTPRYAIKPMLKYLDGFNLNSAIHLPHL